MTSINVGETELLVQKEFLHNSYRSVQGSEVHQTLGLQQNLTSQQYFEEKTSSGSRKIRVWLWDPSPNGPPSLHDVARGRRVEAMNPALAKGTEDVILPGNQQIYQ